MSFETPEEEADWRRYEDAMHAMQTAVGYEINRSDGSAGASPKHLRVGVNSAMVNDDALLHLLIDKGITTRTEFTKYLADSAERELKRYQDRYPQITFV